MMNADIEIYGSKINVDLEIVDIKINRPSIGKAYYTAALISNGEHVHESLYGEISMVKGSDILELAEKDLSTNKRLTNFKS